MRRAKESDKALVVDLLSRAFDSNASVNFVVRPGPGRSWRISQLMQYSFCYAYGNGEVFLSDDNDACALVDFPCSRKSSVFSLLRDVFLSVVVIGPDRVNKILRREKLIKSNYPTAPFAHLGFIGVDPEVQGSGKGTALMRELMLYYDRQHMPVYLETSVKMNLPLYGRFGFDVYKLLDPGYTLYLMRRPVGAYIHTSPSKRDVQQVFSRN